MKEEDSDHFNLESFLPGTYTSLSTINQLQLPASVQQKSTNESSLGICIWEGRVCLGVVISGLRVRKSPGAENVGRKQRAGGL